MIRILITLMLSLSAAMAYAADEEYTNCFSPETNETVKKFLTPNVTQTLMLTPKGSDNTIATPKPELNEDAKVITEIHEKVRKAAIQNDVDPRIIYGMMIAASQGNPSTKNIESPTKEKLEVYGLFGFRRNAAEAVHKKCDKAKQPRLCQMDYYLEEYLPNLIATLPEIAKLTPDVCKKKKWSELSEAEKFSYLALDNCSNIENAKRLCLSDRKYQNSGACTLISDVVNWSSPEHDKPKIPLCGTYMNPAKAPTSSPVHEETPKKKTDT